VCGVNRLFQPRPALVIGPMDGPPRLATDKGTFSDFRLISLQSWPRWSGRWDSNSESEINVVPNVAPRDFGTLSWAAELWVYA
jgi:hypothetical protein